MLSYEKKLHFDQHYEKLKKYNIINKCIRILVQFFTTAIILIMIALFILK